MVGVKGGGGGLGVTDSRGHGDQEVVGYRVVGGQGDGGGLEGGKGQGGGESQGVIGVSGWWG